MSITKEEVKVKCIQKDRVLTHLTRFGSITSKDAIDLYAITRLSAVIFNIRKAGEVVDTVYETGLNRFGEKTRYARYYLRRDV